MKRELRRFIDLAGRTFGSWSVEYRAPNLRNLTRWWCVCACGTRRSVLGQRLRDGKSTSCGCSKVSPVPRAARLKLTNRKSRIKKRERYQAWRRAHPLPERCVNLDRCERLTKYARPMGMDRRQNGHNGGAMSWALIQHRQRMAELFGTDVATEEGEEG